MAFIIDLKPVQIEKLQRKLQRERDQQAKAMKIKRALENRIQKNPIKRNQFSID